MKVARNKDGHYVAIKGSIHQKDPAILKFIRTKQ